MFNSPVFIGVFIAIVVAINIKYPRKWLLITTICIFYGLLLLDVLIAFDTGARTAITSEMQKGEVAPAFLEGIKAYQEEILPERLSVLVISAGLALLAAIGFRKK